MRNIKFTLLRFRLFLFFMQRKEWLWQKNHPHRLLLGVCRWLFSFFLYVIFIYNISLLSYSITIASVCCRYSSKKLCMHLIEYDPFFLLIVTFSFFLFCFHIEDSIISALFANIPFFYYFVNASAFCHFPLHKRNRYFNLIALLGSLSHISLFFFSTRRYIYTAMYTMHATWIASA